MKETIKLILIILFLGIIITLGGYAMYIDIQAKKAIIELNNKTK